MHENLSKVTHNMPLHPEGDGDLWVAYTKSHMDNLLTLMVTP